MSRNSSVLEVRMILTLRNTQWGFLRDWILSRLWDGPAVNSGPSSKHGLLFSNQLCTAKSSCLSIPLTFSLQPLLVLASLTQELPDSWSWCLDRVRWRLVPGCTEWLSVMTYIKHGSGIWWKFFKGFDPFQAHEFEGIHVSNGEAGIIIKTGNGCTFDYKEIMDSTYILAKITKIPIV